jgi:hypothetical protein
MVVWLSFLVCTISGQSCHVTVPTEQPFMGMSACQVEAMKSLPAWTEAHEGWHIAKILLHRQEAAARGRNMTPI